MVASSLPRTMVIVLSITPLSQWSNSLLPRSATVTLYVDPTVPVNVRECILPSEWFLPLLASMTVYSSSFTLASLIGVEKLGHPVPESNFVSEVNTLLSQQTHLWMPLSLHLWYLPENGGSVPFFQHTSYCSRVKCFL